LYSSDTKGNNGSIPNIIRLPKSRTMDSVRHVALMEKMRNAYRMIIAYLKGRDNMGDIGVYERIILKLILKK
jgi:effector-binding domain-containing protein